MTVKKGYHCVYETHYHIVFPVKYRKVLLRKDIEWDLIKISKDIQLRYHIEIEKLGTDKNHIHLLCSFHPKYSAGQVIKIFKSITAKQLFKLHPEIKKDLWGGEFWSDGYYVATVGEKGNWNFVIKYINEQGKKPQDINLRLFDF